MKRAVRTTEDFWATLDLALPAEGDVSWHAFAAHDLPVAVERFTTARDRLPPLMSGRPEYRVVIRSGYTVYNYAVEAQWAPDGAIELIAVTVNRPGPPTGAVASGGGSTL